jgi:hypothetical protein
VGREAECWGSQHEYTIENAAPEERYVRGRQFGEFIRAAKCRRYPGAGAPPSAMDRLLGAAMAAASSLSDLAQRAGLGRIGALIRPFFVAGWDAVGHFPRD